RAGTGRPPLYANHLWGHPSEATPSLSDGPSRSRGREKVMSRGEVLSRRLIPLSEKLRLYSAASSVAPFAWEDVEQWAIWPRHDWRKCSTRSSPHSGPEYIRWSSTE